MKFERSIAAVVKFKLKWYKYTRKIQLKENENGYFIIFKEALYFTTQPIFTLVDVLKIEFKVVFILRERQRAQINKNIYQQQ